MRVCGGVWDVCHQAEVQNINSDGTPSLHTRSLKYGKVALTPSRASISSFSEHGMSRSTC